MKKQTAAGKAAQEILGVDSSKGWQTAAGKAAQEILGVDSSKGWLSGIAKAVLGIESKEQALNQVLFSDKKGKNKDAK